jgi:7-keto-8-aminopelargonate synthetase-like enzyme
VLAAVRAGLKRHGLNVAASRITTGNHPLYPALEKDLARFFGAESALLVSTGYATNLVVAQALAGQFSHALLDERAHVALQDAAQLLECPVLQFKHRDPESLAAALQRCGRSVRPVVLTDGMFSHDGSTAPLRTYLKLLPADGLLVVDDAHGAGILGKHGRGTVEWEGVPRDRLVQTVTLSKAFGVYGGAILASRELRARFTATRMFAGSTPLPLPLAHAARRALGLVRRDPRWRARLQSNADFVKSALRAAGAELPDLPGPIVPLHFRNAKVIAKLQRRLRAARILPPLIRYPGGPAEGYFRFVISSEHTRPQLQNLVRVLTPFVAAAG